MAAGNWTEADLRQVQRRRMGHNGGPSLLEPGGILCGDLAGVTGWAYGGFADAVPACGSFILPKNASAGARLAAFENEWLDLLARWRPAWVVLEAPMRLHAQTRKGAQARNEAAARQQYALHGMAKAACWRAKIPDKQVTEADVQTVRQATLGRSKWPDRDDIKPWVVSWCAAMGFDVNGSHDAADACVMFVYAQNYIGGHGNRQIGLPKPGKPGIG